MPWGGSVRLARKPRTASRAATAASAPCPSPSASISSARPPATATSQSSPHAVSPGAAVRTAPIRTGETSRSGCAPRGSTRISSAVPEPGVEYTSSELDIRAIAPSPVPGLPAVE